MKKIFMSVLYILLSFAFSYAISFLVLIIVASINPKFELSLLYTNILFYISFVIPSTLIFMHLNKINFKDLYFNKLSIKNILLCFAIGLAVQPVGYFLSAVGSLFVESNVASDLITAQLKTPVMILIISIGILPAIFEEIMCRGFLFKYLNGINERAAIIISSLLFGIIHLNIQQFIYATALGILFCYLVKKTGSILSSMIVHFTINTSQTVLLISMIKLSGLPIEDFDSSIVTFGEKINLIIGSFFIAIIFAPLVYKLYTMLASLPDKKEASIKS